MRLRGANTNTKEIGSQQPFDPTIPVVPGNVIKKAAFSTRFDFCDPLSLLNSEPLLKRCPIEIIKLSNVFPFFVVTFVEDQVCRRT